MFLLLYLYNLLYIILTLYKLIVKLSFNINILTRIKYLILTLKFNSNT